MEATRDGPAVVERQAAIGILMEEVYAYRDLGDDWDTYGGKPLCKRAGRFAWALLNMLRLSPEIPLPTVAPISTGVMLTWKREGRDTYIEVDDESVLGWHEDGALKRKGTYGEDPTYNVENAVELLKALHSQGML